MSANILKRWREEPPRMVRELFGVTPDAWQDDVLADFPKTNRQSMLASKGVGKTALEAWLSWNFLLTRPHPNIAAVSLTGDNLRDNLWKEMASWMAKAPLLQSEFEWAQTRITHRRHPATWWMSARTWPQRGSREEQANTLAGLHQPYVMFVLDESGGIPDAVLVSAEAALSSCTEGHIVQGGNPTSRDGSLYRSDQNRQVWKVYEVNGDPGNPKRSPRVSLEWAHAQIEQYGRDNPWVIVNVFGRFAPASLNALISQEDIQAAMNRSYAPSDIERSPRVMGVDVARFGDDASVLWPRQGLVAFAPKRWRGLNGPQGASNVVRHWSDWGADACFVDDTGGFGSSWIDQMQLLGRAPVPVAFNGAAANEKYANKRAEMYFDAADWIKNGGQLPPRSTEGMPELIAALVSTTYTFRGDRLILEPKDLVKQRLGYSPDDADSFVLTFASPVAARSGRERTRSTLRVDYQPYVRYQKGGR